MRAVVGRELGHRARVRRTAAGGEGPLDQPRDAVAHHRAVSGWENAGQPARRISRFSAAARSGTESTSVPSRSSSRVRVTVLHSEMGFEAAG